MFLERGFVDMANADVTWQKAPMFISDLSVTPRFSVGKWQVVRPQRDLPQHQLDVSAYMT
jgi:hypothetical protein